MRVTIADINNDRGEASGGLVVTIAMKMGILLSTSSIAFSLRY